MSQFNVLSRPLGRIALASVLSIVLGSTAAFRAGAHLSLRYPGEDAVAGAPRVRQVCGQEIIFTEDLVAA